MKAAPCDDFFAGNLTLEEKNRAAKAILDRQDGAKSDFKLHMIISIIAVIFFAVLQVWYIANFPEIIEGNDEPKTYSSRHFHGTAGKIQDLVMLPIPIFAIVSEIAVSVGEYKGLRKYSSYKVYKINITSAEKNEAFKSYDLYRISAEICGTESTVSFDICLNDVPKSAILIDFVRLANPQRAKNYVYDSVISEKRQYMWEKSHVSSLGKYILLPCQQL